MNPETSGPSTGPMKGAAEKIIIGLSRSACLETYSVRLSTHVPTFSFTNTSEMAPPDTDRKALPPKPVKKRKIRCTAMLFAKATGKLSTAMIN